MSGDIIILNYISITCHTLYAEIYLFNSIMVEIV